MSIVSPAIVFVVENGGYAYLLEFFDSKLIFIISSVRKNDFSKSYIGKKMNKIILQQLAVKYPELDIIGEDGEFQTFVLESKFLDKSISLTDFDISNFIRGRDENNWLYSRIINVKYGIE